MCTQPTGESEDLGRGPRSGLSNKFPEDADGQFRDLTSRSNGAEVEKGEQGFLTVAYEHLHSFLSSS